MGTSESFETFKQFQADTKHETLKLFSQNTYVALLMVANAQKVQEVWKVSLQIVFKQQAISN